MESFGLGYEVLQPINPRLIYCAVSVFGRSGPYKDKAGYEALMQAFSGVMSMTGEPDGPPLRCGVSFLDLGTGMMAAYGVMNALFHREHTGKGKRSKYRCSRRLVADVLPCCGVSAHWPCSTATGIRASHDRPVSGLPNPGWRDLHRGLQSTSLDTALPGTEPRRSALDPRFDSNQQRVTHRDVLDPLLQAETQKYPTAELHGPDVGQGRCAMCAGEHARPCPHRPPNPGAGDDRRCPPSAHPGSQAPRTADQAQRHPRRVYVYPRRSRDSTPKKS